MQGLARCRLWLSTCRYAGRRLRPRTLQWRLAAGDAAIAEVEPREARPLVGMAVAHDGETQDILPAGLGKRLLAQAWQQNKRDFTFLSSAR